ncbi:hypothetical protein VitviT2T_003507 [Vitis vinifera]|uniref:Cell number regulator 1 n=1 Tax=Vitis vinifera TaxID=29760 RepID=A0ABY9BLR2_VITVI|nr:hypothetical protein VitviT2T_003507 [Vitis vinifera]
MRSMVQMDVWVMLELLVLESQILVQHHPVCGVPQTPSSTTLWSTGLSHSSHAPANCGHVGHATAPGFQNPSPAPPPRYAAPYVVQYPGGTIRWSSGLCHCCDDPANFLITCVCPCITFGQIAEIVSKGSSNCAVSGTIYTVLCFIGLPCLYSCVYRSRLRAQYDLEESPCVDCLVHFFCEACSLCQEYRELKSRGFDMGIGWEANADRQRRGITVPPAVAQGMNR